MDGSATFTIVPSRMIISIPAQRTTRASQRERTGGEVVTSDMDVTVSDRLLRNYFGRDISRRGGDRGGGGDGVRALGGRAQALADERLQRGHQTLALAGGEGAEDVGLDRGDERLALGDLAPRPAAVTAMTRARRSVLEVRRSTRPARSSASIVTTIVVLSRPIACASAVCVYSPCRAVAEHAVRARRDAHGLELRGELRGERVAHRGQQPAQVLLWALGLLVRHRASQR